MGRELDERIRDAKADLKNEYEGPGSYDDNITEIADGAVPVYTADSLQCALEDLTLATSESDFGGSTAVEIINYNIGERIQHELYEYLAELDEKWAETHDLRCSQCYSLYDLEDSLAYDPTEYCSVDCENEATEEEEDDEELDN